MCLVYARSGWAPEGEGGALALTSIHGDLAPPPPRVSTPRWSSSGSPAARSTAGEVPVAGTCPLSAVVFPPVRQGKVTVLSRQGRPGWDSPGALLHPAQAQNRRPLLGDFRRHQIQGPTLSLWVPTLRVHAGRPALRSPGLACPCPRAPLPTADGHDVALRGGGGALGLPSRVASGRARGIRLRQYLRTIGLLGPTPDSGRAGSACACERVGVRMRVCACACAYVRVRA